MAIWDNLFGENKNTPNSLPQISEMLGIARNNPINKTVTPANFSQNTNVLKTSLTPEQLSALMQTVQTPSTKEGQLALQEMKNSILKYMDIPETGTTNISPILAASDFWAGTNHLKNYKTPEQLQKEKLSNIIGALGEYGKVAEGLGKNEKDLAVAQLMTNLGTSTQTTGVKPIVVSDGAAGGKLPVRAAADLAGVESGIKNLDNLFNNWKTNVGGVRPGFKALMDYSSKKASSAVPNTSEFLYKTQRDQLADQIASALNGGRATDEDRNNVRRSLPDVGDSEEVAMQKIISFRENLVNIANATKSQFKKSGYNTEGLSTFKQEKLSPPPALKPGGLTPQEKNELEMLRKKKAGG
jgi:hypothetical protein